MSAHSRKNSEDRGRQAFYRRGSNMSDASYLADVDMARDDIFSGPVSESVPTSTVGFMHRGFRSDSTTFTYHDDEDDIVDSESWPEESVILDDDERDDNGSDEQLRKGRDFPTADSRFGRLGVDALVDAEAASLLGPTGRQKPRVSRSSTGSRCSVISQLTVSAEDALLKRHDSSGSAATGTSGRFARDRNTQKLYIPSEDLTIAIAGFKTSVAGLSVYAAFCIITGGLGYLVLRWLPKWRVQLVGTPTPLHSCAWVVIENQWGELHVQVVDESEYGRSLSTIFGVSESHRSFNFDEDDDPVIPTIRLLDYRYMRLCFHPLRNKFALLNSWKDPEWTNIAYLRSGIDTDKRDTRSRVFGKNAIDIEQKSVVSLLLDEAFHPFYVFQIASLVLWSLDEYYYYAACIFIISVASIITTLVETRTTMARLRNISRFECDVRILRNGFWRYVRSSELVPGDVFEITDPLLTQLPCDSLLLTGDCIVNESMLTGESVPVSKIPTTDETLVLLDLSAASVHPDVAKHMLFSGTKIVRARRSLESKDDEAAALAMAVRTGFNTTKGALVRSMLFPKPSGFKFYRDSFRYISVMAGIAFVGSIASFINFVKLGLEWRLIVVRALDLITIIVPPALPATLTIGTNFALQRLKSKQIFCISPQRVNVGGKIDIMCFDKTGTLTEEGLDVLGVRVAQRPGMRFSELLASSSELLPNASYARDPTIDFSIHKAILYTMATCHTLRVVDNELVGDPLDVKMFQFTDWAFEESVHLYDASQDDGSPNQLSPFVARPPDGFEYDIDDNELPGEQRPIELGVLKQFEFVSQLRRASVIVRRFGALGCEVFLKGAPECMKSVCRAESFPTDYDELLNFYTHRGYRVIGCAAKHIPKLNWVKIQKMKRSEAESELEFMGFIVFENKLKPATADVISDLREANIRKVMCTGDNILTAISVARECNLIESSAHCFVAHFSEGGARDPLSRLSWESVDNSIYKLDDNTLLPLAPPAEADASLPYDISNLRNYSLAVDGDVFRWIIDFGADQILRKVLVRGQVFARMSPDEKHELVEKLQSIDYTVGFCGDGANDCGALKAADVGISLSDAEASVAAPFTSRVFDISCVPQVIREGRAALVTSFSCFKYMSLYSAIQFTTVSILYASGSNLGDFQFLFIDLFIILPIAIFMGRTGPYPTLSRKRPTASLVSKKVLTSILGQVAICVLIQVAGLQVARRQPWYEPPILDPEKSNVINSDNTTLFLLSSYQYILSAIVLSVGKPFRQSMAHNLLFVVTMGVTLGVAIYMLLDPAKWLSDLMGLTFIEVRFKLFLLSLALIGFFCSFVTERYLFQPLAKLIGTANNSLRNHVKRQRRYKSIMDSTRV